MRTNKITNTWTNNLTNTYVSRFALRAYGRVSYIIVFFTMGGTNPNPIPNPNPNPYEVLYTDEMSAPG